MARWLIVFLVVLHLTLGVSTAQAQISYSICEAFELGTQPSEPTVVLSRYSELFVVGVFSHCEYQLTVSEMVAEWLPQWSPDGTAIAYISSSYEPVTTMTQMVTQGEGALFLLDAETPTGRFIACITADCSEFEWSPDGSQLAFLSVESSQKLASWWILELATGDSTKVFEGDLLHDRDSGWWLPNGNFFILYDSGEREELSFKRYDADLTLLDEGVFDQAEELYLGESFYRGQDDPTVTRPVQYRLSQTLIEGPQTPWGLLVVSQGESAYLATLADNGNLFVP